VITLGVVPTTFIAGIRHVTRSKTIRDAIQNGLSSIRFRYPLYACEPLLFCFPYEQHPAIARSPSSRSVRCEATRGRGDSGRRLHE
jgi:hypothetical protein